MCMCMCTCICAYGHAAMHVQVFCHQQYHGCSSAVDVLASRNLMGTSRAFGSFQCLGPEFIASLDRFLLYLRFEAQSLGGTAEDPEGRPPEPHPGPRRRRVALRASPPSET